MFSTDLYLFCLPTGLSEGQNTICKIFDKHQTNLYLLLRNKYWYKKDKTKPVIRDNWKHIAYRKNTKCQKCAGMGLNDFILKEMKKY